jgi:phosphatidylglycerol:prolipoprotein diacylglycerol transferase
VREAAEKAGLLIPDGTALINLPRHPSQLYEALFEGVVLWFIIWMVRNKKPFKGFTSGLYLLGYGVIRFFLEYFREPDADLGYRIQFIKNDLPLALAHPPLSFSTGQILCFVMILTGGLWLVIASRLPNREPIRVYPSAGQTSIRSAIRSADEEQARKNDQRRRRKLRKKLR